MSKEIMSKEMFNPHTTSAECTFVRAIGSFARSKLTRKQLLEGYIEGAEKRTKWDGMDKKEVLATARYELKRV